MKCLLLCVPLLALAPLGRFVGSYAEGAGMLSSGSGLLISVFSILVLPWIVSAVIASAAKFRWPVRTLLFVGTLVLQPVLMFRFVPAGYTCEMMGLAHRVRREYPIESLRACADRLRQKQHDGTLKLVANPTGDLGSIYGDGVVVDDNELPAVLRGRFARVKIWHVPDGNGTQVISGIAERTEIIFGQSELGDQDQGTQRFDEYPLADGVYVYKFHRRVLPPQISFENGGRRAALLRSEYCGRCVDRLQC